MSNEVDSTVLPIDWHGPFRVVGGEPHVINFSAGQEGGVYLLGMDTADGFLSRWVGQTSRSVHQRLFEHVRNVLTGCYETPSVPAFRHARREFVWSGTWDWGKASKRSWNSTGEFVWQLPDLAKYIQEYLTSLLVVVAVPRGGTLPIDRKRFFERMEAALAVALSERQVPREDFRVPFKDYRLKPRRNETPLHVRMNTTCQILDLPSEVEI